MFINTCRFIVIVLALTGGVQARQVSCVGDSITYGYGISNPNQDSYPAQLESLLRAVDGTWRVSNFGVNATTLLHRGDYPYVTTPAYQQALASQPDLVIIMLGTNDSKPQNWVHKEDFVSNYCTLIDRFQTLPTHPEVWICKPVPALDNSYAISPTVVNEEIPPLIDQIAAIKGTPVIDLYYALLGHGNLFPDGIHPNAEGAGIMARTLAPHLLGVNRSADFTGNGVTNLFDLAHLALAWLCDSNTLDLAPVPEGDNFINTLDLVGLSRNWLTYPGIVAHWPLDEESGDIALDRIGDFNGVLYGDPVWCPNDGVTAGALRLDGINDYVNLGYVLNPKDGPFTLIVWVQGGGPGQVILSQESTILLGLDENGALMTTVTDGGRGVTSLTSDAIITDGLWHEISLVWDGTHRAIYADQQLAAQDTSARGNLRSSRVTWLLGASGNKTPGTFWSGMVDDIRVYDQVIEGWH